MVENIQNQVAIDLNVNAARPIAAAGNETRFTSYLFSLKTTK